MAIQKLPIGINDQPKKRAPGGGQESLNGPEALSLDLSVQPGASRSEVLGLRNGRLRVRIAAAPEDGKANSELKSWLSRLLGCQKKDIVIKTGEKSRLKTLGLPRELRGKLEALLGGTETKLR
ncbi:MAG: DUF167 domain-containing protein [Spirochaetaceae bacterium]|jgi:uncharacterized protein (TIGR00251 family)|nr:DUF167 domain-containing protein [Spirochaetaceae bacterium]